MISKLSAIELLKRKAKRRLRIKKGTSGSKCGYCGLKLRTKKRSKTASSLAKREKQNLHWPRKGIFGSNCGFKLWTRKRSRTAIKRSLQLNDIAIKKKHSEWAEIRRRMQKLAEKDRKVTKRIDKLSDANKKARDALKKLDKLKCHISSRIRRCNRLNTRSQLKTVPPSVPQTMVNPIEVPVLLDNGTNYADGQEDVVADQPIPNIEPQSQIADHNVENSPENGVVEEEESQEEETNHQGSIPAATDGLANTISSQTLLTVAPVLLTLDKETIEKNCGSKENKIEPQQKTPKKSQSTVPKPLGDDTVVSDNVLAEKQNQESASIQQDSDQIQAVTTLPNILPQLPDSASTTDPATKETSSNQLSVSNSSGDPTASKDNRNDPKSDSNSNVNPLSVADQDEGSENKVVEKKPAAAELVETSDQDPNQPLEPSHQAGSSENNVVEKKLVDTKLIETSGDQQKIMILSGKLCIFYTTLLLKPTEYWGKQGGVLKKIFNLMKGESIVSGEDISVTTELMNRRARHIRFETAVLYRALNEFMIESGGKKYFATHILLYIAKSRGLEKALEKTENAFFRELDNCVDTFIKISLEKYLDYHKNRQMNSSYKENPKFEWRSSLPGIQVPAEYPIFKECRLVREGKEQHTKYICPEPKDPIFAVFYMFLSETTIKSKVLDLDFCIIETAIAANLDTDPMEFEKKLFGGIFESYEALDPCF